MLGLMEIETSVYDKGLDILNYDRGLPALEKRTGRRFGESPAP